MKINGTEYGDSQPVQLIFEPESRVIVSFPEGLKGRAEFAKEVAHIKRAMEKLGIAIPPYLSEQFPDLFKDKEVVHLDERGFGKAFYEIYFCANLNTENFKWRLIDL